MEFKRRAFDKLLEWKQSPNRKPLVLRGARQVGKTTLVRMLGRRYGQFIELNLDQPAQRSIFQLGSLNEVLNAIQLTTGTSLDDGHDTLVFIDEIQGEPRALHMLRYFREQRPELHVVAAGSLLEFALKDVESMPVGRVQYQYLHPLNFPEFLEAVNNVPALDAIRQVPLQRSAHAAFLPLFHDYAVIGGMPEVVASYVAQKDMGRVPGILRDLWATYRADVQKYARNHTERRVINHVMATAPYSLDRIKYEGFGQSNYRSREVSEALQALDRAGLIRTVRASTSVESPVVPDLRKRPRLQFLDTGLVNEVLQVQGEMIGLDDLSEIHKGRIIQHLVVQELISLQDHDPDPPCFWVREAGSSNAEVDVLYPYKGMVFPVEIKSGPQGRLRSLHQFVERSRHPYAVRFYAGNPTLERHQTPGGAPFILLNLPYYLATQLPHYLSQLVEGKLAFG